MNDPGATRPPVAPLAGTLLLVAGLAAVTGCLDAVSLARVTQTFVGFQTGNLVLVGLGVGRGHFAAAAGPAVAVIAFLVGSAATPAVLAPGMPGPVAAARRLLAIAVALLIANAVVVVVGAGFDGASPSGAVRYVSIVLSAWAMASQTSVVRRVRGVTVSSTFSTGMLTRLGQSLGNRDPARRAHERVVTRVLGVTIVGFVLGAVVGGVFLVAWGNGAVVVPALGLVLVAVGFGARRPVRPADG